MAKEDRLKTTFRTKWGNFTYRRIPFGLINVGATFQRAMDIAFHGFIGCSLDFDKDFILYTFASDDSLAAVLT